MKVFIEKIKMSENSKNEVEFRRNMYFLDLILAREARHEKLYNEPKANKTHWHDAQQKADQRTLLYGTMSCTDVGIHFLE